MNVITLLATKVRDSVEQNLGEVEPTMTYMVWNTLPSKVSNETWHPQRHVYNDLKDQGFSRNVP